MAALTNKRVTDTMPASGMDFPLAANVKIHQGAFVCLDNGYLVPASAKAGLTKLGTAGASVDNTGGTAGAKKCYVDFMRERMFLSFAADQTKLFVATDLGKQAYFIDDQTLSPDGNLDEDDIAQRTEAGPVFKIEGTGATQRVWVEV